MIKKIAVFNDLSGIGRCSLNVAIPILTIMQHQVCPFPTAILSNQTGFDEFTFLDFTVYMEEYQSKWEKIGYQFDGIYSGFLGSTEQIHQVIKFIRKFKNKNTVVMIDPVMGDNGNLYPIYTKEYPNMIKKLISYADVITPNYTEFLLLSGKLGETLTKDEVIKEAEKIAALGPKKIVITGVIKHEKIYNLGIDFIKNEVFEIGMDYNAKSYSGTGDILASIVSGSLLRGESLKQGVQKATEFISRAIEYTEQFEMSTKEGILYEPFLKNLSD